MEQPQQQQQQQQQPHATASMMHKISHKDITNFANISHMSHPKLAKVRRNAWIECDFQTVPNPTGTATKMNQTTSSCYAFSIPKGSSRMTVLLNDSPLSGRSGDVTYTTGGQKRLFSNMNLPTGYVLKWKLRSKMTKATSLRFFSVLSSKED